MKVHITTFLQLNTSIKQNLGISDVKLGLCDNVRIWKIGQTVNLNFKIKPTLQKFIVVPNPPFANLKIQKNTQKKTNKQKNLQIRKPWMKENNENNIYKIATYLLLISIFMKAFVIKLLFCLTYISEFYQHSALFWSCQSICYKSLWSIQLLLCSTDTVTVVRNQTLNFRR